MSESTARPIRIALALNATDVRQGLEFIDKIALERHGCLPPPPPQVLFVAKDGDEVVGTIALDFREEERFFPLEEIYSFATPLFPRRFRRREVAQFGRWMSSRPGVSAALGHIAALYAVGRGKIYGWFEAKEPVAARIANLGVVLGKISGACLILQNIPEGGRNYYIAAPVPELYTIELAQVRDSLGQKAAPFIVDGQIVLDTEFMREVDEIQEAVDRTRCAYQNVAKIYDMFSAPFHAVAAYPKILSLLETYLGPLSRCKILDIGCGGGGLMQNLTGRGARCWGIDITPAFLEIARSKGFPAVEASMHSLPFPDETFDAGVSNYVLNYLPPHGQKLALKEKHRVLRKGGLAVFSYMHPFSMRASPYKSEEPHYSYLVPSYFEPVRQTAINQLGQEFKLYLLDWPEIVNLVVESGFRILRLVDADIPENLEEIASKMGDEQAAGFIRSFRYNPYAMFIVAEKQT